MKKLISTLVPVIISGILSTSLFAQSDNVSCTGYPKDEDCCLKNRGVMVTDTAGDFCYLNLFTSRVTKAQCMEAGGYAYWRNDSTMLCLPKGIMVMTGDVTSVDESAKTMILTADGTTYTILGTHMMLPASGERIDVYFTVEPDGSMVGKTCQLAKP